MNRFFGGRCGFVSVIIVSQLVREPERQISAVKEKIFHDEGSVQVAEVIEDLVNLESGNTADINQLHVAAAQRSSSFDEMFGGGQATTHGQYLVTGISRI